MSGCVALGVRRGVIDAIAERAMRRIRPTCIDAEGWRDVVWIEPRVEVEVSFSEVWAAKLRDLVPRTIDGARVMTSPITGRCLGRTLLVAYVARRHAHRCRRRPGRFVVGAGRESAERDPVLRGRR